LRRELSGGLELDDDPGRIDVRAVHAYLSSESYWAAGRTLAEVVRTVGEAARVIGLYDGQRQIGFARVIFDGFQLSQLCDVYVLPEYRGVGCGVELVREAVDNGPQARLGWTLATQDAHGLYARFDFTRASDRIMRRPARS
jgi:GNAT superfamily N-acetyltransferase